MAENRFMASTTTAEAWPTSPHWFRLLPILDRAALGVSVLAVAVELVRALSLGPDIGGLAVLLATLSGVVVSRFLAWPGLLLVAAGSVIAGLVSWNLDVPWTVAVFTLFSVTVRGRSALPIGVTTGLIVYLSFVYGEGFNFGDPLALVALTTSLASAASGTALRARQGYWLALEQRAADAVATREIEANRRVAEERVRIARDLHDVVGHEVALLGMHLGVAEVSLPPGDSPARTALDTARDSVRRVLHETQLILDVLRGGEEDGQAKPAPDIEDIQALVESFRAAGVDIEAHIAIDGAELDPTVSLAGFRIVQEALTNARRYGRGPVQLQVRCAEGYLTIVAENDRAVRLKNGDDGPGYGLVGMRERALSAGGRLTVDGDSRRFRVQATLRTDGGKVR
ncbi:sensor histidine kinase [Arthrobacter sp. UC242_113]|uniref:sensor histidine kinase n=1 Tax=Arthrobacter sp. UC242_113 TaxID=3374550 RepID=UPI0037576E45